MSIELRRAGVDGLEGRAHAYRFAHSSDARLGRCGEKRDLRVGEADPLRVAQFVGAHRVETAPAKHVLRGDDRLDAPQEPRIDAGQREDVFDAPTAPKRLGDVEKAVLVGNGQMQIELVLVEDVLTVRSEPIATVLQGAERLTQRLFERTPYRHHLAHRFHARGERLVGAAELLERPARHLDHRVVDARLEARRRGARDVVIDLVERVAHCELRGNLGDGESGRLGRKRRRPRDARVHLDDRHAAVGGVHCELHVAAAGLDADLAQNRDRGVAHRLVLAIGERLRRCDGDRVAGMHSHGVDVLDGAHDDGVVVPVAHDLHLELFPADDALLDEYLAHGRQRDSVCHDVAKLIDVVGDAATGAPHRERRANHARKSHLGGDGLAFRHGIGVTAAWHVETDSGHGLAKEPSILSLPDHVEFGADELDAVLLEDPLLGEGHGTVQTGLSAHRGKQRVGALGGDDLLDELRSDGLEVCAIGEAGVGHDRGRVAVDEHDLEAVVAQDLARLRARVVELARLTDNDRSGTDHEDLVDVCTAGHLPPTLGANAGGKEKRKRGLRLTTNGQGASRSSLKDSPPSITGRSLPPPGWRGADPVPWTSGKLSEDHLRRAKEGKCRGH